MTIAEKVKAAGHDYELLLKRYCEVLEQTGSKKSAADYIFWLSEDWDGSELFTLSELIAGLEKESDVP